MIRWRNAAVPRAHKALIYPFINICISIDTRAKTTRPET